MMIDYIMRLDALIDVCIGCDEEFPNEPCEPNDCKIKRALSGIPTADVVEVVRCKDCKYYVIHTLFGHTQGWCERLCDEHDKSLAHGTEVNDYCSYGERKEE